MEITMFCYARSQTCSFDWRGEIQVLGSHILDLAALESQNLKSQSQSIGLCVFHLLNLVEQSAWFLGGSQQCNHALGSAEAP